nr:uncharacterized protein LOC116775426 [Danaus plexippus plexippus]
MAPPAGAQLVLLGPRLLDAAAALGRIFPNLRGPTSSCRRLYIGVVKFIALYGIMVWANSLKNQSIAYLRAAQRVLVIRIVRGYKIISSEAAFVLAGSLPWDLEAKSLALLYW